MASSGAFVTRATLHGYAVAFWWAAGLFGFGAVVTLLMLESGPTGTVDPAAPLGQISGQG